MTTTTHRARRCLALAFAAVAVTVSSPHVAAQADAHPSSSTPRLTSAERHLVKHATRRFRDPAVAVAAGYVPTPECAELPGVGGMGYHYVHPGLSSDNEIIPTRPEILVYVPTRDGKVKLGAVEYFHADADQDPATSDDRPFLLGTYAFDGPMPGHEPGMPLHDDLHVWLYKKNPTGQLSAWNPRVHCPS